MMTFLSVSFILIVLSILFWIGVSSAWHAHLIIKNHDLTPKEWCGTCVIEKLLHLKM